MRYLPAAILALTCAPLAAEAPAPAAPPLRIWGTPAMLGLAERWAEAFRARHPEVRFEFRMKGSDSAIHGLTGGVADLALMGRENDEVDDNGFARPKTYPATRIEVANGSLAAVGKSPALAVLVPEGNPLRSLSVAQLGRILSCGVGGPRPIRTWGELGLKGAWAARPVRVYAPDLASRTGRWLQDQVAGKERRMCWDRIVELDDARRLDGTIENAAERVGKAARADPAALAIADAGQAFDGLRVVGLAAGAGAPPRFPTRETIAARAYPLQRAVYAFVDRKPGTPLPPVLAAFLRFVLSPEGQAQVRAEGDYIPLDAKTADAQAKIVEELK